MKRLIDQSFLNLSNTEMVASSGNSERRLLVEFVGAAGVGKSFLAARLLDSLRRRGVPVVDVERSHVSRLAVWIMRVRASTLLGALKLRPRNAACYVAILKRLALYKARHSSCRQGSAVRVADEGIFQKIRAFYRYSRLKEMTDVADYVFEYLSVPDIVVVVSGTPETIFAQRAERQRRSDVFTAASVRDDVALLEHSVTTIRHVQGSLANDCEMVHIDVSDGEGDAAIEILADRVHARFESLI